MTALALQLSFHGSILLLAGLVGGLLFACAIKLKRGEVAWRVVHAGGVAAGVMLLALAVPSQWMSAGSGARLVMGIGTLMSLAGCSVLVIGLLRALTQGAG